MQEKHAEHAEIHPQTAAGDDTDHAPCIFEVTSFESMEHKEGARKQHKNSLKSVKKGVSFVGGQLRDELKQFKYMDVNADVINGFSFDSIFFPSNNWHGKKRIGELVFQFFFEFDADVAFHEIIFLILCTAGPKANRRA